MPTPWHAQLNFDLLEKSSSRSLWTARDLFEAEPNYGIVAHLGRYFKKRGFSHRTVRGLVDVRSSRVLPQCTLWRTKPGALPLLLRTERGWREQYHKQLFQFAAMNLEAVELVIASLCRDLQLDDRNRDPDLIRLDVMQLRTR